MDNIPLLDEFEVGPLPLFVKGPEDHDQGETGAGDTGD
jgi:hypothetical protein